MGQIITEHHATRVSAFDMLKRNCWFYNTINLFCLIKLILISKKVHVMSFYMLISKCILLHIYMRIALVVCTFHVGKRRYMHGFINYMGALSYVDDITRSCPGLSIMSDICNHFSHENVITFNSKKAVCIIFFPIYINR